MVMSETIKSIFKFPFPCVTICGRNYTRLHLKCLTCRDRKWHTYDLDRSKYLKTEDILIPKAGHILLLFKKKNRKHKRIKEFILLIALTVVYGCLD